MKFPTEDQETIPAIPHEQKARRVSHGGKIFDEFPGPETFRERISNGAIARVSQYFISARPHRRERILAGKNPCLENRIRKKGRDWDLENLKSEPTNWVGEFWTH